MTFLIKSIISGLVASLVPIIILKNAFDKKKVKQIDNIKYDNLIISIPIMFIVINIIIMNTIATYYPIENVNWIMLGALFGIIYSTIGRIQGIPQKILDINPNVFQFNALILWAIYYNFLIKHIWL